MRVYLLAAVALFGQVDIASAQLIPNPMQIEICKATVAIAMGRPTEIMRGSMAGRYPQVEYTRQDGTLWQYQCKIDSALQKSVWRGNSAGTWGRWREGPYDSPVFYEIKGGRIHMREAHADSTQTTNSYPLPAGVR